MVMAMPLLTPFRITKRQEGRWIKPDGEPSFTLTAVDRHGILIVRKSKDGGKPEAEIRIFTPEECERLQGFPSGWTEGASDMKRYEMLGNAVTVGVVESIGRKLRGASWGAGGRTRE